METDVHFLNLYGERLYGTHHRPGDPSEYGIVMGHCFTCTRHTGILRETAMRLAIAGFHVLRFDFSGNGQSQGEFIESSYSKYMTEMESAADFLKSFGVTRPGFAGHSMGAAVSVLAASKIPGIRAVCAVAGRLTGLDPSRLFSPDQMRVLRQTGRLPFMSRGRALELDSRFFSDMRSHDIREAVASLPIPLLIVHGSRDEIVSVEEATAARSLNPGHVERVVIEGADHFFSRPDHRDQAAGVISGWFEKRLKAEG